MEQLYKFNHRNYNDEGTNTTDGKFFLENIEEWEVDFHDRYSPFFSTHLFANVSTMVLIKHCLDLNQNEDCGMDLIDGEADLKINFELERHSQRPIIYGIGSKLNEDEPILLVRDDTMDDGMILLKYIPDSDDGEEVIPEIPVETDQVRVNK